MPKRVYDWNAIQAFYDRGNGFVACRNLFGLTHTAWNKAIKRGELRAAKKPFRDRRRRYDWASVQQFYEAGHTYRECRSHFGFCAASWSKAVCRGELQASARRMPLRVLLETSRSRGSIKRRLLEAGILQNICQQCGLDAWHGQPISMHLDHINGVRNDHRLANLRMLCPNCHSQTPTYGGKNAKRRRVLQDHRPIV